MNNENCLSYPSKQESQQDDSDDGDTYCTSCTSCISYTSCCSSDSTDENPDDNRIIQPSFYYCNAYPNSQHYSSMVLPGETTIPFKKRYIYKKNIKQYLRPEMGWGYHEPCTATGCFTGGPYELSSDSGPSASYQTPAMNANLINGGDISSILEVGGIKEFVTSMNKLNLTRHRTAFPLYGYKSYIRERFPFPEQLQTTKNSFSVTMLKSFRILNYVNVTGRINWLNFSPDGIYLIALNDENKLTFYNALNGMAVKRVKFYQFGCKLAQFFNSSDYILMSTTNYLHQARLLSSLTSETIRYFRGHKDKIISLSENTRLKATFMTGSLDKTLRLWDIRMFRSIGGLAQKSPPIGAFLPNRTSFLVGEKSMFLKFYDMRAYSKGPFQIFDIYKYRQNRKCKWTSIVISPNGLYWAILTNRGKVLVLNTSSGQLRCVCRVTNGKEITEDMNVSFSPNNRYLLASSKGNHMNIWDMHTGNQICTFYSEWDNPKDYTFCKFNPSHVLIASAGQHLNYWIPTLNQNNLENMKN